MPRTRAASSTARACGRLPCLRRVRPGEESFEALLPEQAWYEVHFTDPAGRGEPRGD
ncbi:hypothetical protein [Streptomyces sp. NPDC058412]|uniref:hypothetical protein n=1 Tax=Streptomyces sp. NPDC058412 TaxID=3346486 RepID=UPI0036545D8D